MGNFAVKKHLEDKMRFWGKALENCHVCVHVHFLQHNVGQDGVTDLNSYLHTFLPVKSLHLSVPPAIILPPQGCLPLDFFGSDLKESKAI